MFKINKSKFFELVKPVVGIRGANGKFFFIQSQIDGLTRLLQYIEQDNRWQTITQVAYFLATVAHECCRPLDVEGRKFMVRTFQPITEFGGDAYLNKMYDTRTDLGNTPARDGDGAKFGGKGYVQNTGAANAAKAGKALTGVVITIFECTGCPREVVEAFKRLAGGSSELTINANTFTKEPMLLLIPRISYLDAVHGMFTGRYTGKKITDYISKVRRDLINARRVINRLDKAHEIASLAESIERVLAQCLVTEAQRVVDPTTDVDVQFDETPVAVRNEGDNQQVTNVITDTAPVGTPATGPVVEIKQQTPSKKSLLVTIGTTVTGIVTMVTTFLTQLGIEIGSVKVAVGNTVKDNPALLVYALIGLVLVAVGLYFYNQSMERATQRTLAEQEVLSDPTRDNVIAR